MLPNDATPTPTPTNFGDLVGSNPGDFLQIIFGHGAARLNLSFPVIPTGPRPTAACSGWKDFLHQLSSTNKIWEMEEMEIYIMEILATPPMPPPPGNKALFRDY